MSLWDIVWAWFAWNVLAPMLFVFGWIGVLYLIAWLYSRQ
jgi:hypothetical protein